MSKNRNQIQRRDVQFQAESRTFFAGPLPPPEKLAQYNQIVPGAAERIIKMAEDQAAHRMELESKVINSDIMNSRIGLFCGFALGLVGMIGGVVLIYYGKTIVGTAISGGTVASLAVTFVYGSQQRRKERVTNQQVLQR